MVWDYAAKAQSAPQASSGWYDETKLAEAIKSLGNQADGRLNTLTGDKLLSILNPVAAPRKLEDATDGYWYMGDQSSGAGITKVDGSGVTYVPGGSGEMSDSGGYRDANGNWVNYRNPTPRYYTNNDGPSGATLVGVGAPEGQDPNGEYFQDQYDSPTGNGKHDQAVVTYKIVGDKAVPVAATNAYQPSNWVDWGRDATKILGTVLGAGAVGAAIQGGYFGTGAAAGGAGGGGDMTAAELAANGIAGGSDVAEVAGAAGAASPDVAGLTALDSAAYDMGGDAFLSGTGGFGTAGEGGSWLDKLGELAKQAGTSIADFAKTPAGAKAIATLGATAAAGLSGSGTSSGSAGSAQDAASQTAALGQQQLAWNQAAYAAGQPTRDAATANSLAASNAQLVAQTASNNAAAGYQSQYDTSFAPVNARIAETALGYDTAGRRADAAASAQADVENAYSTAAGDLSRSLGRSGIAPGSGRALALMGDQSYAKAGSIAGATTGAVRNVESTGQSLLNSAAGIGGTLRTSATNASQIGAYAGTGASNSAGQAVASQSAGLPQMNVGFSGAAGAAANAGNLLYGTASLAQKDAANQANLWASLGGAAGSYLASSDEDVKTGTGKPANTKRALAQIESTQVDEGWKYDPEKGGVDDGGKSHIGPMAQRVRATMGGDAAPGGKAIDLVNVSGRLLAGMQELSKKVKKLEKKAA